MKKRGFTLVELMITLSIFSIFSIFLYQTFFSQIRESFDFNNKIEQQYNINRAMNMITDQIRNNSPDIIVDSSENKIKNGDRIIIDLNSQGSPSGITGNNTALASLKLYYNPVEKVLWDDNGNKCSDIDSIIIAGDPNNNDLIKITVYSSAVKSITAVNVHR